MKEKLDAKNWNLLKLQRYQGSNHDAFTHLGTQTWESAKFKGTLYDFDTPINEFLENYVRQYDAVEYQESFVDVPSERRVKEMRARVEGINDKFKFCPTIPRRISHEFTLGENHFDLKEYIENIAHLGPHLGPSILRLPETFTPASMKLLQKFLKLWPVDMQLAIHPTNGEWYKKPEMLKILSKEVGGKLVSVLIEDRIELPVPVEKLLVSDHLIIRFYGRPNLNQDDQRLALWVYRLGEYKAYGIKDSFFFLYEQEEMCLSILRKMANSMGGNVRVPSSFDMNSKQMGFLF